MTSIDIILPNGALLTQPLCKVLGHKMGACFPATASIVTTHIDNKGISSKASDKPHDVFDRLGPVTEPSLGSAEGQVVKPSHNCDLMSTKFTVASGEWAIVKSKKARRAPSISSRVVHTTDQGSTIPFKGKELVVSPSGTIPITYQNPSSFLKGKEPVRAPPNRKGPDVVIASPTSVHGQRRSTSRTSGSSRVPPLPPPM
ncbi:hypothetical protein NC653_003958 [Populus alba x Populus x berolinensis]|nr:hypothetical protein NC653_003958 [Populus alba x Populus x berolinensis]